MKPMPYQLSPRRRLSKYIFLVTGALAATGINAQLALRYATGDEANPSSQSDFTNSPPTSGGSSSGAGNPTSQGEGAASSGGPSSSDSGANAGTSQGGSSSQGASAGAPASPTQPILITAGAFLQHGEAEAANFGLYSYILFGSRPQSANRQRYLSIITAYLDIISSLRDVQRDFAPPEINITYFPLTEPPLATSTNAEWYLEHYDFNRARHVLARLTAPLAASGHPGYKDGIYIISTTNPISSPLPKKQHILYQDLTKCDPTLAQCWIKAFIAQATQPCFWQADRRQQWLIQTRQVIIAAAASLEPAKTEITAWTTQLATWTGWITLKASDSYTAPKTGF